MATDNLARMLAFAALEAASEGGGDSKKGIDQVYILDGELHIVFSDGTDTSVGEVVGPKGEDGKVYVPHIDPDTHILSWTIEDKEGEIPDPFDLSDKDEWEPMEGEGEGDTDFVWDPLE